MDRPVIALPANNIGAFSCAAKIPLNSLTCFLKIADVFSNVNSYIFIYTYISVNVYTFMYI
jgi:hypothetical protein